MKDRAVRRAQVERIKKSRAKYWGGGMTERKLGKVVHTPAICSCWMCGNDRKFQGERTIQERRQMQDLGE